MLRICMHVCACADGGHNVILEIQSTLPSDPVKSGKENPTLKPMMFGVYIAYSEAIA